MQRNQLPRFDRFAKLGKKNYSHPRGGTTRGHNNLAPKDNGSASSKVTKQTNNHRLALPKTCMQEAPFDFQDNFPNHGLALPDTNKLEVASH